MKKIVLCLCFFSAAAVACVCTIDIVNGFVGSRSQISATIDSATAEIERDLIPAIERNIADVKKQNEELEKLLKAYTLEAEQKRHIIFYLEEINNIQ
jgi:lipoprotein